MTDTSEASPSDHGLQAERTGLAWTRTSLGVAANAALLSIREIHGTPTRLGLLPAALALVVALAVALYGHHRALRLRTSPLPSPLAARTAVPLLGATVIVLALLSGVVLVL